MAELLHCHFLLLGLLGKVTHYYKMHTNESSLSKENQHLITFMCLSLKTQKAGFHICIHTMIMLHFFVFPLIWCSYLFSFIYYIHNKGTFITKYYIET